MALTISFGVEDSDVCPQIAEGVREVHGFHGFSDAALAGRHGDGGPDLRHADHNVHKGA